MDTTVDSATLTLPVDPEHAALRLSVVGILILSCIGGIIIFGALIPGEGLNLLAGILGFAAAVGVTWFSERMLKQRWPSGRTVAIHEETIQLSGKRGVQQEIDGSKHVNTHFWRFKIKRGSRMKGWFVIACALEQDGNYLAVYTFVSPDVANAPNITNRYKALLPTKESDKDLRLAGEQRRLRMAEGHRWERGAEMSQPDFERFLARLERQFPRWMPTN